jgi:phosphatidate phosphatase APP1
MIRNLRASLLLPAFCILISGCGPTHTLSSNESVRLESAICYQRPDGTWAVPIRGSVYQKSWLNRIEPSLVEWLHSHKIIKGAADEARLESRLALFLEDHPSGIALEVMVGETPKTLSTSQGGLIAGDLILTSEEVNNLQSKAPPDAGWLTFRVRNAKGDHREFLCEAEVLPNRGLSIVSDIDDTIKITEVNNTKHMLENTFLLPFRSVPGMAELYAAWKTEKSASFHYLSLGPVQLYGPLVELFTADGFPKGTMDLPMIKWGHSKLKGFMSMMDGTPEFKEVQLRHLIDALPERDYVLIGDSSQFDPESYADTARHYPKQVRKILIRDVTCQGPDAPRYQETFRGLPRELWQIFTEPAEIRNSIPAVSVNQ